jgi:arylsulfatase A-like enzyme
MKFRYQLGLIAALFVLWSSMDSHAQDSSTGSRAIAEKAERPNVLFIAVDDLNAWVTHLGRNPQAKTPNIDRLANMGTTFSRAYCAVPACNPARAALMTGQRPWTTACYKNGEPWKKYTTEGFGLSNQFKKAGYHVAGAGKIYHSQS